MPDESRWKRGARIPSQELQGQAVIVVPARREMHELDEAGTLLWNALARERTVPELVDVLCAEYEVEREVAEKDVRAFLGSLEEKGLAGRT